jgi:dephospho-CoA kinase
VTEDPRGTVSPRHALRIGITGPIGCGKSTVASWLGEWGAAVVDADQVARGVTPAGSPELAAIVDSFGTEVLRPDGSLDRAALGLVVFADPAALARLEAIIHPAVRPRILALIAAAERTGARAVAIEAIKLVEGGLAALCDEVWLVTCDRAVQRARLLARAREPNGTGTSDGTAAAADTEARIAAQGDLVARLAPHATRVIDTSGSIAESRSRVLAAWGAALSSLGS